VLDWCRANGVDYILGVAPTTTLRRHIEGLEAKTKARFEAAPKDGKLRRFKEFFDGAASWSRVERIIARVEVGAEGPDTRFVVTNLKLRNARVVYDDVYCRRGQAENHIKSWKTHLAADRTSCTKATGQAVPAVPARRRLLADVGFPRIDAPAFDVARCAVRHLAPAADQSRRTHRRDEDHDTGSSANIVPRPGYSAPCTRAHPSPRHISDRAQRLADRTLPINPQTFSTPPPARSRRRRGASTRRRNREKSPGRGVFSAIQARALHNAGFRNGPVGVKSLVPTSSIFGRPRERASQIAL
jgi:hypothetical protein